VNAGLPSALSDSFAFPFVSTALAALADLEDAYGTHYIFSFYTSLSDGIQKYVFA
jgi:hypothetical protein